MTTREDAIMSWSANQIANSAGPMTGVAGSVTVWLGLAAAHSEGLLAVGWALCAGLAACITLHLLILTMLKIVNTRVETLNAAQNCSIRTTDHPTPP